MNIYAVLNQSIYLLIMFRCAFQHEGRTHEFLVFQWVSVLFYFGFECQCQIAYIGQCGKYVGNTKKYIGVGKTPFMGPSTYWLTLSDTLP